MLRTRITFTHVALLAAAAMVFLGLAAQGISRAETPVLAPGVESLAIDGNGVSDPTAVVDVATSTPEISGRIMPGKSTAVLGVDGSIEWEVEVDPTTGEFSTAVPESLGPGEHTLYVDGVAVATFNVPESTAAPDGAPASDNAPAGVPASGGGGVGSGDDGLVLQPWLLVFAGLVLGAGVFLVARRKPSPE
jgi:hypothetical protein